MSVGGCWCVAARAGLLLLLWLLHCRDATRGRPACLPTCLPALLLACLHIHANSSPHLPPTPPSTAERLLRHLHDCGVPFCLATSSHLRHYGLKTTLHQDLFQLFDHRVTGMCRLGWGWGVWMWWVVCAWERGRGKARALWEWEFE